MMRNLISFLIFGFIWLFLFSIPVGHNRILFDVGHYYFVDTKPVRWLIEKFNVGVKVSQSKASETMDQVVDYVKQPDVSHEEGDVKSEEVQKSNEK